MDDSLKHKIAIETTHQSEAKLLRGKIKTKRVLHGRNYEATLKMRNDGEKDFPGGKFHIQIKYANAIIHHTLNFDIPKIRKGEEGPPIKFSKSALGTGYASFFGEITANDGERVKIIRGGQEVLENASFYDIFIESWTDVYTYYLLIITIISLSVLAVLSSLQLISFWIK